jgi:hypothetical protein
MTNAQKNMLVSKLAAMMGNATFYGQELHFHAVAALAKRFRIATTKTERVAIWDAAGTCNDPDEARAMAFDDAELVAQGAY